MEEAIQYYIRNGEGYSISTEEFNQQEERDKASEK